ncbi:MAG TPA: SUF system NifU family Fe-S cluster assembly protein [Gemmatimonadales bacterium]|nr:SUF system NifU family Fe-S cluster assembly protein [Gemmatimonadales bacterium]
MNSKSELYQSLILDHNRAPRNYHPMAQPDRMAEGYNPNCGDQLKLWVKLDGDRIADISFEGNGCAISRASASLMTTAVKGRTRADALAMFEAFHHMITGHADAEAPALPAKLQAFAGVSEYPQRVKCAGMAWHALKDALKE